MTDNLCDKTAAFLSQIRNNRLYVDKMCQIRKLNLKKLDLIKLERINGIERLRATPYKLRLRYQNNVSCLLLY